MNEIATRSKLALREKTIYSGTHAEVTFEIHFRKGVLDITEDAWNFYVFLHENRFQNFDALWLPCEIRGNWPTYDYNSIWAAQVDGWNGGVTYYRKHGEVSPFRCVELGCDFAHSWDHGMTYEVADIYVAAIDTINNLIPFKIQP